MEWIKEIDIIEPAKPMTLLGFEGCETFKIDDNTIGVRYKWIKCSERLPENDNDVLVYHSDDNHISVGFFEKDNVSFYIESDGNKFYTDSGWETEIPWAQKGCVTHWMPLPSPPKDQE